jgi:hypothetical protein
MTAETLTLIDQRPAAAHVLDQAMLFAQGFAGYRAPAFLTLADANLIARPEQPDARRTCVDRALVAGHNIQNPSFCARTTAMVNAVAVRLDSAYDVATEVERFTSSSSTQAVSYGSIRRVGEPFGYRTPRDHVPVHVVTGANTLESLSRDVFSVPMAALAAANRELERGAQLPVGTSVVNEPGQHGAQHQQSNQPRHALSGRRARAALILHRGSHGTYEPVATTVYGEPNERVTYGMS